MNWESLIGPGVILLVAALGGFGGYMNLRGTLRAESRETERRFKDSEDDRKELRNRIEAVDRDTVKRNDFQRFDDKVAGHFEKLEHTVNNGALKTAELLKGSIRSAVLELLPQLRGHE